LCRWFPGFFKPGEAERAAKLLGVSWKWFKRRYLEREDGMLRPAVDSVGLSGMVGFITQGTGQCTFFRAGRCRIHAAKPYECRVSFGCTPRRTGHDIRAEVVKAWRDSKAVPSGDAQQEER
jgi:Fe-S-cluster containining protein